MFRKYDEFIIYVYEIRRKFSHLTELEAVQSVTLAIQFFFSLLYDGTWSY